MLLIFFVKVVEETTFGREIGCDCVFPSTCSDSDYFMEEIANYVDN